MKKILLSSAIALISFGFAFAEKGFIYISPNNDGVQDFLEVPIQIKEKRYVNDWHFIIENKNGDIVRTIENKDKRESRITFKSFFKSLITPKKGVDIPKSVIWNGVMDNGEVAPDGNYNYYMVATDDNGNTAKTNKYPVIVDNTAPEINLNQPSNEDKIFGEGAKTVFNVKQNGSKETSWTGVFTNAKGDVVKTLSWTSSEPLSFNWNGTDDTNMPLPDGVYSYKISATDEAGNKSAPATISNIIFSAEKPATNITLSDSKYINPLLEGMKEIKFDVKIPVPSKESGNKLVGWSIVFLDSKGNTIKTVSGTDNPPSTYIWNGIDDNGNIVADSNSLQAKVTAKYLNGFETAPVKSPVFTLDTKAPKVTLSTNDKIFSPNGDENKDTLIISQKVEKDEIGAPIDNWQGTITNSKGEVVKKFDFGEYLPETFVWDGLDSKNQLADDGTYKYTIFAMDKAGNSTTQVLDSIQLDNTGTDIVLTLNKVAFNPNRPADIRITPKSSKGNKLNSFEVSILNATTGEEVWKQEGTTLPDSWTWNGFDFTGKLCDDNTYIAMLTGEAVNGDSISVKSAKFVIDTVPPELDLNAAYTIFSPDADGKKDILPINAKSSNEESWIAHIYNNKNESVKTYTWKGNVESFNFDGTDANGNLLPDGDYKLVITTEDAAGNKVSKEIPNIKVDNRETKAYVTADLEAFSPNGNGSYDNQNFTIKTTLTEGIESWKLAISTYEGKVVKTWTNESYETFPTKLVWDGKGDDGNVVADNVYKADLSIVYAKGNTVDTSSAAFISCVAAPQIAVKTQPQYFSPDNDGEDDDLFIQLKGNSIVPLKNWSFEIYAPDPEDPDKKGSKFWETSGKASITEKIIWDGYSNTSKQKEVVQSATDYPYVFKVTDTLGMTSVYEGKIEVDILVIRDGDKLKMAVPSIIFPSDMADFTVESKDASGKVTKKGISKKQADNNEKVLKRIAKVLNKFNGYTVTVEGHANRISDDTREETVEGFNGRALTPLSKERAKFVKEKLVKYGVSASRLSTDGKGGTAPIVNPKDKANNWKNKRVEFILKK